MNSDEEIEDASDAGAGDTGAVNAGVGDVGAGDAGPEDADIADAGAVAVAQVSRTLLTAMFGRVPQICSKRLKNMHFRSKVSLIDCLSSSVTPYPDWSCLAFAVVHDLFIFTTLSESFLTVIWSSLLRENSRCLTSLHHAICFPRRSK